MKFELPILPFATNALEPYISQRTMEFHYGKHHQAYVNNLNNLIENGRYEKSNLKDIIKNSTGIIFNNAAQVWNHSFYFEQLSAQPKLAPEGNMLADIEKEFGSFENFRSQFDSAALSLFGSGWVWLSKAENGKLVISQEQNASTPLVKGWEPLLTIDVWEHAYYLDYQNRRVDYIKNQWMVFDWNIVEKRYK